MPHTAIANNSDEDFRAFDVLNPEGNARLLLVCDHASNATPPGYGNLGIPSEDFERHIAYDIGTEAVTRALSAALDCPGVLSRFSRLVIDPNRAEDDPTLMMKVSDGSIIPGNRHADAAEIERRLDLCHRPYHDAITAAIARARRKTEPTILSLHSFTRQLRGRPERPWHVSVLWDWDAETAHALLDRLSADEGLIVGDNVPYAGRLEGDCMWRHATQNHLRHGLIEIRNDLIETAQCQREWADRLATVFADAFGVKRPPPKERL